MISDDQVKRILSICEWHDELNRAYAVSEKMLEQMATELLQLREEKRKAEADRAKSWKGAPEWANCRAKDQYDAWLYFELKPYVAPRNGYEKEEPPIGDVYRRRVVRWIATLETRP